MLRSVFCGEAQPLVSARNCLQNLRIAGAVVLAAETASTSASRTFGKTISSAPLF